MVTQDEVFQYGLTKAQTESAILKTMYFGINTDSVLEKINNYENDEQHKLRKKLRITNEYVTDELLRPADNIWEAKGGVIYYGVPEAKQDEFKGYLKSVIPGMSIRQFMKNVWWVQFVTDPNGIILLTVENGEPILKHKASREIEAYKATGDRIDWILFKPHRQTPGGKDVSLYIDKYVFQEVTAIEGGYEVIDEQPNELGMVPAVINSPIYDTERQRRVSPIQKQIDLLRSFLVKNSVKEIYQFLHLYPIFWQIETICPACHGLRIGKDNKVCSVCNGTGFVSHKDVSDVLVLKNPDEDSQVITPPAGYVQPDLATMEAQRIELGWVFDEMFKSHWGTTTEKGKNETATGRFIDVQPVNKKLDWYASIAETVESMLITLFGAYYYQEANKPSSVTYGRRFIIESPDSILKRYQEAKEKNAPVKVLDMLLEQFYYSEYQTDPQMLEYYLKLAKIEPYVHKSIEEVMALEIAPGEKDKKKYFPEWQKTLSVAQVVVTPIEQLNNLLIKFTQNVTD